ncbi:hypothetical protein OS493_007028 [Desmophyllum pertusum]|uniref:Uncharacterized protein n=1 Tax=Desmophyllum pertusum TaxID=174260 RepID=A0A9W9ZFI5_9CNID|nr:hypothetical protein OS493_007028 [Desmophyllum pertusum]
MNPSIFGIIYWGWLQKRLKEDAVPTIFSHKPQPQPKERTTSVARAAKRKRQETIDELVLGKKRRMQSTSPEKKQTTTSKTPSGNIECEKGDMHSYIEVENVDVEATHFEVSQNTSLVVEPQELEQRFVEIEDVDNFDKQDYDDAKSDNTNNAIKGTPHERIMVDETMQFPFDAANEILNEHSYCFFKCQEESSVKTNNDSDFQAEFFFEHPHPTAEAAESGDELFSSPPSSPVKDKVELDPDYVASSQSSQTSTTPSESAECLNSPHGKQILLVYEENLRQLLRFCPQCGSPVNEDEIDERENDGSQYTIKLNCLNNCNFTWQSQPSIPGLKGKEIWHCLLGCFSVEYNLQNLNSLPQPST